jgi:hypothetical protein
MTLQYRPDNDRLVYCDSNNKLLDTCACDGCNDSVACHRFNACCDVTTFEERLNHPHFIVISDSKYTSLGDPSCIVYDSCCYCSHDSASSFPPNVPPSEVTASADTSCDNCQTATGPFCEVCKDTDCAGCDYVQRYAQVSVSGLSGTINASEKATFEGTHIIDGQSSPGNCGGNLDLTDSASIELSREGSFYWRIRLKVSDTGYFRTADFRTPTSIPSADAKCNYDASYIRQGSFPSSWVTGGTVVVS